MREGKVERQFRILFECRREARVEQGREKRTEHETSRNETSVRVDETGEATAQSPGGDHGGDTDIGSDCRRG